VGTVAAIIYAQILNTLVYLSLRTMTHQMATPSEIASTITDLTKTSPDR
jgi:hypothetical protein